MGDTILNRIMMGVGGLLIAGLVVGIALWGFDYGVSGTVVEKDRDAQGPYLVLGLDLGGFEVTHHLSETEYLTIQPGHYVVYHVQSGNVKVFTQKGGELLYDSAAVPGL